MFVTCGFIEYLFIGLDLVILPALSRDASDKLHAGKYEMLPSVFLIRAGLGSVFCVLPIDVYLKKKTKFWYNLKYVNGRKSLNYLYFLT